jgi:hypothetical protein
VTVDVRGHDQDKEAEVRRVMAPKMVRKGGYRMGNEIVSTNTADGSFLNRMTIRWRNKAASVRIDEASGSSA